MAAAIPSIHYTTVAVQRSRVATPAVALAPTGYYTLDYRADGSLVLKLMTDTRHVATRPSRPTETEARSGRTLTRLATSDRSKNLPARAPVCLIGFASFVRCLKRSPVPLTEETAAL